MPQDQNYWVQIAQIVSPLISLFTGIVTIIAVLMAPIYAVRADKDLEKQRQKKNIQHDIFSGLMKTRRNGLSELHVEALNLIDIYYYNDKSVIKAWKKYRHWLRQQSQIEGWATKRNDLLVELLIEMGKSLGYEFDETEISDGCYLPIAHEEQDKLRNTILQGFANIIEKKTFLNVGVTDYQDYLELSAKTGGIMVFPQKPQAPIVGQELPKGYTPDPPRPDEHLSEVEGAEETQPTP